MNQERSMQSEMFSPYFHDFFDLPIISMELFDAQWTGATGCQLTFIISSLFHHGHSTIRLLFLHLI